MLVSPDHTRQLDCLQLCGGELPFGRRIEAYVGIQPKLVADMAARQQWAAAWTADIVDIQFAEARGVGLLAELLNTGDRRWRAPKRTARRMYGPEADTLVGKADGAGDATGYVATNDVHWTGRRRLMSGSGGEQRGKQGK